MGLDIKSEDNQVEIFSASYSIFCSFRIDILSFVTGLPSEYVRRNMSRDWNYAKRHLKRHPNLTPFMMHSDCDGCWTWEECSDIQQLLESVLPKISQRNTQRNTDLQETTTICINGLKYCVEKQMDAVFM